MTNPKRTGALGVLLAALVIGAGCGPGGSGSGAGEASMSGTLLGKTVTPVDALTSELTANGMVTTSIIFADFGGLCADLAKNAVKANGNAVVIRLVGAGALAAGTYMVGATSGTTLEVQFAEFDATCNSPAGESASAGTVTVTRADGSAVAGTFDLTFNSDHVTGTFTAPVCSAVAPSGNAVCN